MSQEPPRTVFYGSPDFALPVLQALIDGPYRPAAVVTQPDRGAGRGRKPKPPPVKQLAERHGIPALQPDRLRGPDAIRDIAALRPDLQIVAAYGQILPPQILDLPRHGTLNVHASLLPRWRGASPVNAAIRHGDPETGVTIMLVDETEDTGDILAQRAAPISATENAGRLSDRLARLGADLLIETIPRWLAGEIDPRPQDQARATRARRLEKSAGRIDWSDSALEIERQVRACTPWPGAYASLDGGNIRITHAEWIPTMPDRPGRAPGQLDISGDWIGVQTGRGTLAIRRLQRAGKREMSAAEFARGAANLDGAIFEPGPPRA